MSSVCPAYVAMCAERTDSPALAKATPELVQQPGTVLGAHLDHRRLARRRAARPGHAPGRACRRPPARSGARCTGAARSREPSGPRSPCGEPGQAARDPARGPAPSPLGDSTCHSLAATPSTVRRIAVRTTRPYAARSPAVSANRPSRSRSTMSMPVRAARWRTTRPAAPPRATALEVARRSSGGLSSAAPPASARPGPRAGARTASASCSQQGCPPVGPGQRVRPRRRRPRSGRAAARGSPASRRRPHGRATVRGSWWSRRVASSMSVRCSRTSVVDHGHVARRAAHAGSRSRTAMGAPVAEWSCAPRTLPMSCSSAASSSRSARPTPRAPGRRRGPRSPPGAGRRCGGARRCAAGRERTAVHSGSQASTMPGLVQALPDGDQPGPGGEQVDRGPGPASGHGVAAAGALRAGWSRVAGASGRLAAGRDHGGRAAAAPGRSASRPRGPSTTSPSCSNSP